VEREKLLNPSVDQRCQNNPDFTAKMWIGLFIASFLIRALFGIYGLDIDRPFAGDEGGFHWRAVKILEGSIGQRAHRAPLTAVAIVPAYSIFGATVEVGRWMMILISSLGAPLVFSLGSKISGNQMVGSISGIYWAVYPPSIIYTAFVYTETLSAVLILSSVICYLWAARTEKIMPAFLTGLVWGCLALNRATFLLLPFFLMFSAIVFGRFLPLSTRFTSRQWISAIALFCLTLTPWVIHTYSLYGTFMPHNTRGGSVLLVSNGNLDSPMVKKGGYSKEEEYNLSKFNPELNKYQVDTLKREMAVQKITDHLMNRPGEYALVIGRRIKNFWSWRPDPYDEGWTRNDSVMFIFWVPVLLGLVASLFFVRWAQVWPVFAVTGYSFLVVLPFWSTPRFRFPIDALLVVIAVWSYLNFSKRARRPSTQEESVIE